MASKYIAKTYGGKYSRRSRSRSAFSCLRDLPSTTPQALDEVEKSGEYISKRFGRSDAALARYEASCRSRSRSSSANREIYASAATKARVNPPGTATPGHDLSYYQQPSYSCAKDYYRGKAGWRGEYTADPLFTPWVTSLPGEAVTKQALLSTQNLSKMKEEFQVVVRNRWGEKHEAEIIDHDTAVKFHYQRNVKIPQKMETAEPEEILSTFRLPTVYVYQRGSLGD
eukprot:TRINITY_DN15550_c0_g1_i1.p1 TRINITY_DN15550_c0_g1~~TRINITY_DN15550_c0_g1_i1.p1  ORF type:complete len:227 (-),score=67.51 TRINITY_DN15550_c0_g1_i1:73-753(-)